MYVYVCLCMYTYMLFKKKTTGSEKMDHEKIGLMAQKIYGLYGL